MKTITVSAILALCVFSGCNKGDGVDPPPPAAPTCHLARLSFSTGTADSAVYSFQYSGNTLTGISLKQGTTTTTRTFGRSGNTILVKPQGSNIVDSVFLNYDGLILRHRYRQFIASGIEEITEYAYVGTEVYRRAFARFQNASPVATDTTYYQWTLGNLSREIHNGAIVDYSYDTDRPIPAAGGDVFQLRTLLLQGAPVFRNRHFVSTLQVAGGGSGEVASYEFDSDGKVTRMSGADGTYKFRYDCK